MKKEQPYDVYEKVLRELETFYNEIPNRCGFRKAVEAKLTPDDCEIWLLFPKHTETPVSLDEIRKKNAGKIANIDAIMQKLEDIFFISEWSEDNGVKKYVRNYIFKIGVTYSEVPGYEDDPITIATQDWFNTMVIGGSKNLPFLESEFRVVLREDALTGESEDGSISMNIDIPDTREVVPYDYVTEMIKQRKTICLTTCYCRVNKDAIGTRKCDYPTETCLLFDDLAERTIKVGGGRQITVEEALELTARGRDMGLVHNISNANNPSVLCQCCSCCCLVLNSMLRGEGVCGKASRYVVVHNTEKCTACGKCSEVCPAGAMEIKDGKTIYDASKCIGCGICVANCKDAALSMKLREDADKYMPDVDSFDVLYI